MTNTKPLRCSGSNMAQRGVNEVVLLNTGSYPGVATLLNKFDKFSTSDWTLSTSPLSAGVLPTRTAAGLCYDGYNIVIAGGKGASEMVGALSDTYTYNGTTLTKEAAKLSYPRLGAQLVLLNTAAPKAVMFGGSTVDGELLSSTTVWNGNLKTWTDFVGAQPPARIGHAFSGGPTNCVVFGGKGTSFLHNDVWSFDNTAWTKRSPTGMPAARVGASMAYDVTNSRYVLFGGSNGYELLSSSVTYTLNSALTVWTAVTTTGAPPPRMNAQMCYDTVTGGILLFGGTNGESALNDTWLLLNSTWSQL